MKLFKYNLSDWKKSSDNWWRYSEDQNFYIGLRLKTKEIDPQKYIWVIDVMGTHSFIRKLFENTIKFDKKYSFEELDKAKQDIDNMIVKLNKLQCFI